MKGLDLLSVVHNSYLINDYIIRPAKKLHHLEDFYVLGVWLILMIYLGTKQQMCFGGS